jgi:hypothetical protein
VKAVSVKKREEYEGKNSEQVSHLQLSKKRVVGYIATTRTLPTSSRSFTDTKSKREVFMGENKGKPSGSVAQTKKDAGKPGDIKEIGRTSGAKKKKLSSDAGIVGVAGGHPQRK